MQPSNREPQSLVEGSSSLRRLSRDIIKSSRTRWARRTGGPRLLFVCSSSPGRSYRCLAFMWALPPHVRLLGIAACAFHPISLPIPRGERSCDGVMFHELQQVPDDRAIDEERARWQEKATVARESQGAHQGSRGREPRGPVRNPGEIPRGAEPKQAVAEPKQAVACVRELRHPLHGDSQKSLAAARGRAATSSARRAAGDASQ